VKQKVKGTFS